MIAERILTVSSGHKITLLMKFLFLEFSKRGRAFALFFLIKYALTERLIVHIVKDSYGEGDHRFLPPQFFLLPPVGLLLRTP